jgi:hypothetical protein
MAAVNIELGFDISNLVKFDIVQFSSFCDSR